MTAPPRPSEQRLRDMARWSGTLESGEVAAELLVARAIIAKLRADNERLRGALESITACDEDANGPCACVSIASCALAPVEPGDAT